VSDARWSLVAAYRLRSQRHGRSVAWHLAILSLIAVTLCWIRINISPSLPYGFYLVQWSQRPILRGSIVVVSVPGWGLSWLPLLKPVAAVAGDVVCRIGSRLTNRGHWYGDIHDEFHGHPLPSALQDHTCLTVGPDQVFLASEAPRSLDSRYFGPVALAQIRAVVIPLLTWSGGTRVTRVMDRPEPRHPPLRRREHGERAIHFLHKAMRRARLSRFSRTAWGRRYPRPSLKGRARHWLGASCSWRRRIPAVSIVSIVGISGLGPSVIYHMWPPRC
jgi:type IV secretory pathway protease TraF